MRSRYSAYVLNLSDYLRDSWHPRTRPARLDLTDAPGARTTWLGLTVHRHTVIDADHAQVEFTARYRVGGTPAQRLRESSRFVCEHGRWYYLDGDIAD